MAIVNRPDEPQHDAEPCTAASDRPGEKAAGPLRWMTAADAADVRLVDTWTPGQVDALAALGEAAITFALDAAPDGRQWMTDAPIASIVLLGLGVEHDRIWTRGLACVVIGGAVDTAGMPLHELAAGVCLRLDTKEPRLLPGADAELVMTEQGGVPREGLASDDPSVTYVGDGQGTWMAPLRTWVERQPEATRALFPDSFWLDPIYLVGAPELHTAVLAAHPEQVTRLRTINEALVEVGEAPFPVYGPEDVERYVGGLVPLMDWPDQARLVMQVSCAIVKGVRCGEQGMKERLLSDRGHGNYL